MENMNHKHTAAQAVVLLTALMQILQKSPHSTNTGAAEDLVQHITGMQESIMAEANINADVLDVTEAYALNEWRADLVIVLFQREHWQNLAQ